MRPGTVTGNGHLVRAEGKSSAGTPFRSGCSLPKLMLAFCLRYCGRTGGKVAFVIATVMWRAFPDLEVRFRSAKKMFAGGCRQDSSEPLTRCMDPTKGGRGPLLIMSVTLVLRRDLYNGDDRLLSPRSSCTH